ncbi:MAG: hypothetical protein ACLGI7_11305, partial [Gammaproteobacteria bacterium]
MRVDDASVAEGALQSMGFVADQRSPGFVRYIRRPLRDVPEIVEVADVLFARRQLGQGLIDEAQRSPVRWNDLSLPVAS